MGSVPVWYGTQMLPRVLGENRAREMVYLCHQYTAREALQMGNMISMAYGTEEFHEGCRAFTEKRKPDFNQFRK
jgi:1,4-dihydroxy-2-naphthoyl-CoA synthase